MTIQDRLLDLLRQARNNPSFPSRFEERQRQAHRLVIGLLAVLTAVVCGATVATLWRLHAAVLDAQIAAATSAARGLEDHVTQSLRVVDVSIEMVGRTTSTTSTTSRSDELTAAIEGMPQVRSMSIIGSDGRVAHSSNPVNIGVAIPVGPFFPTGPGTAARLRVGIALPGRDLATLPNPSTSVLAFTAYLPVMREIRPLSAPPVKLLASLNPDYFVTHFDAQVGPAIGTVHLLRYDGTTLLGTTTRPPPPAIVSTVLAQRGSRDAGLIHATADGTPTLAAWRSSRAYPLLILVDMNISRAMTAWRWEALTVTVIVLSLLATAWSVALGYLRRLQRLLRERDMDSEWLRLAQGPFDEWSGMVKLEGEAGPRSTRGLSLKAVRDGQGRTLYYDARFTGNESAA